MSWLRLRRGSHYFERGSYSWEVGRHCEVFVCRLRLRGFDLIWKRAVWPCWQSLSRIFTSQGPLSYTAKEDINDITKYTAVIIIETGRLSADMWLYWWWLRIVCIDFDKFLSFLRRKASWLDPVLYCFTFPISFSTRSVRGAFGDQIKPITSVKPQFPRANSKCEKRWWSHQLRLKPWTFNIGLKWTCE